MSRRTEGGRSVSIAGSRAVSETIGFVLAFALVTASVGVVYTTGIGGLEDAREDEQLTNAVRAFEVLADNVKDVQREGAPSRATELKLNGGSIGFGERVRFTVQVNHTNPDVNNVTVVSSTRPLVYDDAAGEVVYSGGATIRDDDSGWTAMRVDPGFVVGERRAVVPLLVSYPHGDGTGIGGDSTVLVVARGQSSGLERQVDTGPDIAEPAQVTVTVESPRAATWGRYFEAQDRGEVTVTDSVVTYNFETERLLVPETIVEFELQA